MTSVSDSKPGPIDGRSVYTSYFFGVHWKVQYLMLQDIQRIDVIRRPGRSFWEANAANDLIDIIPKSAGGTQGGCLAAGGGNIKKAFAEAPCGGRMVSVAQYRVYTKEFGRGELEIVGGEDADDWRSMRQDGFRFNSGPYANFMDADATTNR